MKPITTIFFFFLSYSLFAQSISGAIRCANGQAMEGVQVTLTADGFFQTTVTDSEGQYIFENLSNGATYTVMPFYDDNSVAGVTTFDVVQASQLMLNIAPFSPMQLLAYDVNGNGGVSTYDLLLIRQWMLGMIPCPSNPCWKFATIAYLTNPLADVGSTDVQVFEEVSNVDFVGVKTGDFDFSACP